MTIKGCAIDLTCIPVNKGSDSSLCSQGVCSLERNARKVYLTMGTLRS